MTAVVSVMKPFFVASLSLLLEDDTFVVALGQIMRQSCLAETADEEGLLLFGF